MRTIPAIKTDHGYYVTVPSGVTLEQGGKPFRGKIFLDSLEGLCEVISKPSKIIHYKKPDGSLVSVEEYSLARNNLEKYFDGCEYDFPDLDTEFKAKKGFEPYKTCVPVLEKQEPFREPVYVEITGYCVDTGSDYIESAISLHETSKTPFVVNVEKIIRDFFEGKERVVLHTSLEFIKIGNTYLKYSGLNQILPRQGDNFAKTVYKPDLQSAKEYESFVRQTARQVYDEITKETEVPPCLVVNLRAGLDKALSDLRGLEVKSKSEQNKSLLVAHIREIILSVSKVKPIEG